MSRIEKDPIAIKLRQILRETKELPDIIASKAWQEEKPKLIETISKILGLTEDNLIKLVYKIPAKT